MALLIASYFDHNDQEKNLHDFGVALKRTCTEKEILRQIGRGTWLLNTKQEPDLIMESVSRTITFASTETVGIFSVGYPLAVRSDDAFAAAVYLQALKDSHSQD